VDYIKHKLLEKAAITNLTKLRKDSRLLLMPYNKLIIKLLYGQHTLLLLSLYSTLRFRQILTYYMPENTTLNRATHGDYSAAQNAIMNKGRRYSVIYSYCSCNSIN